MKNLTFSMGKEERALEEKKLPDDIEVEQKQAGSVNL